MSILFGTSVTPVRQLLNPDRPQLQRLKLFVQICVAIVDRCDAGDDTGFVVEDGFDDVRGDAEHRHVGRHRPAQVVETPVLSVRECGVQPFLEATETRNGRRAGGREHEIRVLKARHRFENVDH